MRIKEMLHYDPITGIFTWLDGRHTHVKGKRAGWEDSNGYRSIQIDGLTYRENVLAWYMHYGVWPAGIVDHKNRVRNQNNIDNLRLATKQQNNVNSSLETRGVYKHGNKWKAQIKGDGKQLYLGLYNTKEEAYSVVYAKHKELHGEFSPCA